MALPDMTKHKGFPSGMPGTGFQFTLRRANPKGASKIIERKRYADRSPQDTMADTAFLHSLWHHFGSEPFERGNLDAGRLSWLFGREVIAAEEPFDPESYQALLQINVEMAEKNYPEAFKEVLEI